MRRAFGALAVAAGAGVCWGVAESYALRRRVVDLPLADLPPALDGLRVLHLSDVHGGYGPGLANLARSLAWARQVQPDLVAITGDLVARRAAAGRFAALARQLWATAPLGAFAVLGNHDFAQGNDPFAQGVERDRLEGVDVLDGELRLLRARGCTVSLTGANGRAGLDADHDYSEPRDHGADLRILLCHYPWVHERLPPGSFQLVLSGHLHAGQICVPLPAGRIPLAHPTARHLAGTYVRDGCTMHVSPGLGTTFVGLRVLARPEATLLVLRRLP